MSLFLKIFFFIVVTGLGLGFYLKSTDPKTGELLIGLSMVGGFFVLMPLFIYHRWKDRNVQDYMLNKENIMKMHEYQNRKRDRKKD
jgi:RsiW-degrading membrane proteinase PrsW (M82 family)